MTSRGESGWVREGQIYGEVLEQRQMRETLSCVMPIPSQPFRTVVAELDATLDVRVVRRVAMLYAGGADPATDRPAHVRAGSGLAWVGTRLAVVQDDANFIALVNVHTGYADSIALPAGHGGLRQFDDARGNKAYKNDFESLVSIPDRGDTQLLAFGSGSTPLREKIAILDRVESEAPTVRVIHAPAFYAALRANQDFSGSQLNIEGVTLIGGHLRLFNRGNGAPRDHVVPVNASCDVDIGELLTYLEDAEPRAVPRPHNTMQYELGEIGGTGLSFTDAISLAGSAFDAAEGHAIDASATATREPRILYSAAAEASPDAVRDGEVHGSAIGIYENVAGRQRIKWAPVRTTDGEIAKVKVEGIARGTLPGQLYAVVDSDDHTKPSELYELRAITAKAER